jgi:hypothetical protein
MNIRRRLQNLECRPFRRPVARRDGQWILPADECAKMRDLQKKLCLPLPDAATTDERQEALRLMQSAVARTRIDIGDTAGLDAVRDYALGLHAKYGTDPTWGE